MDHKQTVDAERIAELVQQHEEFQALLRQIEAEREEERLQEKQREVVAKVFFYYMLSLVGALLAFIITRLSN